MNARLTRMLKLEAGEIAPVAWAFGGFFCLLCGYYILRPLRDEMGIQGGVDALAWVFSATFLVMLAVVPIFGWVVARFSRRGVVVFSNGFFVINLLLFFVLMRAEVAPAWVARAFFVWVSVFNLFVVSLFWSVMNDVFDQAQALRLFGVIAAGGSFGAIAGPGLTALLVEYIAPINLLPLSAAFLTAALICVLNVLPRRDGNERGNSDVGTHGQSVWAGAVHVARSPYLLGICAFIVLYSMLSTFLYFEQARIVESVFETSAARTQVFAGMDLATNTITLALQFLVTARLVVWIGLPAVLALIPVAVAIGFGTLGLVPTLAVLVVFQIIRRAGNYAITRPAREMLFSVVRDEDKYKAKNFIDTVVYRGGDAVSGWLFTGLAAIGFGLSALAFAALPLAAVWAGCGYALGRARERHAEAAGDIHSSHRGTPS